MTVKGNFKVPDPQFYRDTAATILDMIYLSQRPLKLDNQLELANSGMTCEWCYVIDLDARQLEVYRGQHEEPHLGLDRFRGQVLVKSYPLLGLPPEARKFVNEVSKLTRASS